jgi:bis(5'-nucleosyl)-tetraphosphatase (symmetrical)
MPGIPPIWSLTEARSHAQEAAELLRGKNHPRYLRGMYGNKPDRWSPQLTGIARFRAITNYFTRMRFCAADGRLELTVKESSAAAPRGFAPWFTLPMRHDEPPYTLLFGHWAALDGHTGRNDRLALDTGCVWGRRMTMLRLEDRHPFTVACR